MGSKPWCCSEFSHLCGVSLLASIGMASSNDEDDQLQDDGDSAEEMQPSASVLHVEDEDADAAAQPRPVSGQDAEPSGRLPEPEPPLEATSTSGQSLESLPQTGLGSDHPLLQRAQQALQKQLHETLLDVRGKLREKQAALKVSV